MISIAASDSICPALETILAGDRHCQESLTALPILTPGQKDEMMDLNIPHKQPHPRIKLKFDLCRSAHVFTGASPEKVDSHK